MKPPARVDLTTGAMSDHYRALAIPAAIGMVFTTLYNMVEIYFAGRLDTSSQAGLAAGFMVCFIFVAFGVGLGFAMSAQVRGAFGAGDPPVARRLTACRNQGQPPPRATSAVCCSRPATRLS